jgi:type II secretory pathway component PulC
MENRVSPEDKLLNVIRGNRAGKAVLVPSYLAIILEKFLLAVIAVVICFIVFLLLPRNIISLPQEQVLLKKENFTVSKVVPISFYQDIVSKRKLFGGQAVSQVKIAGNDDISISQISSNFNLSGIIAGDTPKAIIEDKKAQKSYFLKEGESIGEVKLNKIGDGKVIMEYRGTGFELVL